MEDVDQKSKPESEQNVEIKTAFPEASKEDTEIEAEIVKQKKRFDEAVKNRNLNNQDLWRKSASAKPDKSRPLE